MISGEIWDGEHFEDGYVVIENGIVKDVVFGETYKDPVAEGMILPGLVDYHTHIADAGLRLDRKYSLEELVAPPNGLKHRYLRDADEEKISEDMARYSKKLIENGVSRFMDFREGGVRGAVSLRKSSDRAIILGRPISEEYDPNEMDQLLDVCDGIGISSISDMDAGYIERIADAVHKKNKLLALHVSERIREDIDQALSLEPDLIIHMVQATESDLKKCSDKDVPVVVCASSNQYFGMTPNIKMMYDCNVDVVIGTDNAMLSPSADMCQEFNIFCSILKSQGGRPEDAFRSLMGQGRKTLYQQYAINTQVNNRADIIVMQSESSDCSVIRSVRRYL